MKKKILSFVFTLVIVLSFSVTAFGGPGGGGIPPQDGPSPSSSSPIIIEPPIYPDETE